MRAARVRHLPRGPVLDWSSFRIVGTPAVPSVQDLPERQFTTSGRAAIYQALLQLRLPAGSAVLVPSYHCPTMVAPVLLAGFTPCYFALQGDGLPALDTIDDAQAARCRAMIVSHYFGYARSLSAVRQWCDHHGIALIEDCAHCYFGQAGSRAVGTWGDYATASLSKFMPLAEGGMLASARHPIGDLRLEAPGAKAQVKGWLDVFETATRHGRFAGLNTALTLLMALKRRPSQPAAAQPAPAAHNGAAMMRDCDMSRVGQRPSWASRLLYAVLPRGRIITRRRHNYVLYARHFASLAGARPLFPQESEAPAAPYVFPLWVDDPDPVYEATRAQNLPVFRWDRIWPGTPTLPGDAGPLWSHHVLQLLCHQDLDEADIASIARAVCAAVDACAARRQAGTAGPASTTTLP